MWYEIPNIDSMYKVTKEGIFMNTETGRVLTGEKMNKGYIRMALKDKSGKKVRVMTHILVALTFIGEPPTPEHQINHINLITSDNNYRNLEWVTSQENIDHKMNNMCEVQYKKQQGAMSKIGKEHGYINGKKSAKPVAKIDKNTNKILKIYSSAREAQNDGFSYRNISQVCLGQKKTHLGYIWKFVE